jgi:hypothetical protein
MIFLREMPIFDQNRSTWNVPPEHNRVKMENAWLIKHAPRCSMIQRNRSCHDSDILWTSSNTALSRNSWIVSKISSEPCKSRSLSFSSN